MLDPKMIEKISDPESVLAIFSACFGGEGGEFVIEFLRRQYRMPGPESDPEALSDAIAQNPVQTGFALGRLAVISDIMDMLAKSESTQPQQPQGEREWWTK